jgi:hypothetical protein
MNTENIEKLKGTKFLFNKNLVSYENLVKLLRESGLNTDYIQKPIKDKLEVHSLFIKPDFEVAFLAKSKGADEYYSTAGYSCINYKEVTIQEVLDVLGYNILEIKEQKEKKQKYITITDLNGCDFTFKKKKIYRFSYNKKMNNLEIIYLDDFYKFNVDNNRYLEIKEMIES